MNPRNTLLLLAFTVLASSAFAQRKSVKQQGLTIEEANPATQEWIKAQPDCCTATAIKPGVTYMITPAPKILLQIQQFPMAKTFSDVGRIDSLKLYVKKSKLRWLNDSTAIVTP